MSVINDTPGGLNDQIKWRLLRMILWDEATMLYNTLKGMQGEVVHNAARPCQKHRGKPLLLTISALGSFMCITKHVRPTALRPIGRLKQ